MGLKSQRKGKRIEYEILRYLGGQRSYYRAEDGTAGILVVESKHRKRNPAFVTKGLCQAEAAAEDGKIPVFVMHEERQEYGQSLAVMRLKDLRDLVGD